MKLNSDVCLWGKKGKETRPTKRSMNLCVRADRTAAPATASLYVLFGLVVLLALGKVLFYDPLSAAARLEQQALSLEQQAAAQMEELQSYNQILAEYLRAMPTEEEEALVDRMELLSLIDRTIRPEAEISQISMEENKVLLAFSGVTLGKAAELVARLEESPLVAATSVDTAASTQEGASLVEVHVYFEVVPEEGQS